MMQQLRLTEQDQVVFRWKFVETRLNQCPYSTLQNLNVFSESISMIESTQVRCLQSEAKGCTANLALLAACDINLSSNACEVY
jgi:hypothetical protein